MTGLAWCLPVCLPASGDDCVVVMPLQVAGAAELEIGTVEIKVSSSRTRRRGAGLAAVLSRGCRGRCLLLWWWWPDPHHWQQCGAGVECQGAALRQDRAVAQGARTQHHHTTHSLTTHPPTHRCHREAGSTRQAARRPSPPALLPPLLICLCVCGSLGSTTPTTRTPRRRPSSSRCPR